MLCFSLTDIPPYNLNTTNFAFKHQTISHVKKFVLSILKKTVVGNHGNRYSRKVRILLPGF